MGRNLSLLAHLPRFEADGVTHRRDCECVRCDAGFRPSEQERAVAQRRWDDRKAREAAARALARREERVRVRALATGMQLTADVQAADAHVRELREAKARVDADRRLALFQSLRAAGLSIPAALDEVERRDRAGAPLTQESRESRGRQSRKEAVSPPPSTAPDGRSAIRDFARRRPA